MTTRCKKHKWVWLLPKPDKIAELLRMDYQFEFIVGEARLMEDITICTCCGVTGHKIKSHRGGIRVNGGHETYLNAAKKLAKEYNFELPASTPSGGKTEQ